MGFFSTSLRNNFKEVFFMINTTQLVVKTDKRTIEWLERKGYRNILPDDYAFSVFIVDLPSKSFFGTNTTCMAGACSCGLRPNILDLEKVMEIL